MSLLYMSIQQADHEYSSGGTEEMLRWLNMAVEEKGNVEMVIYGSGGKRKC